MMVPSITAISPVLTGDPAASAPIATSSPAFAQMFEAGVAKLDGDVRAAEGALGDLASGKPVELHNVMLQLEQARIGVQTFIQVRNKVLESYQDLMRMQM